jgi:hypothetical protein
MHRFVSRPLTLIANQQKRKASSAVAREPTRRFTELEESHTHHAACEYFIESNLKLNFLRAAAEFKGRAKSVAHRSIHLFS